MFAENSRLFPFLSHLMQNSHTIWWYKCCNTIYSHCSYLQLEAKLPDSYLYTILPLTCFLELFKSCIVIAGWRCRCLNDNFNDCFKRINVLWLFEKNEFCGWLSFRNCNVCWWFRGLSIKPVLSLALILPQLLEKVLETFPKFTWCKTASKFVCQVGWLLLWRQLGVHLRKVK